MATTLPIGTIRAPRLANPEPRVRFRENGDNISHHKALLEQRDFERALDFALLQYQRELAAECTGPEKTGFVGAKMTGAQELVKVLLTLHEVPIRTTVIPNDNLSHAS